MSEFLSLSDGFEPASDASWLKLVEKALKGRPVSVLDKSTDDGVAIPVLGKRAEAARPIAARAGGAPWAIVQRVDQRDAGAANAQALEDLAGGASGLEIVLAGAPAAQGHGLEACAAALTRALEGVKAELIHLRLSTGANASNEALLLADVLKKSGVDLGALDLAFAIDPISAAALSGGTDGVAAGIEAGVKTAGALASDGFKGPFLVADGRVFHEAGASAGEELAAVMASAIAFWRAGAGADAVSFTLSLDHDVLESIAKLRALRLLVARVQEVLGHPVSPLGVHGETSRRMLARADSATNMLRATIACFAGAIGGADTLNVLAYTAAHGLPDAFARRLSRNTQLVLAAESNLYRVADPAAGSGAIEAMTDDLAAKAWEILQSLESAGGIAGVLADGSLKARITASAQARGASLASGARQIIGTTKYPNGADTAPAILAEAGPAPVLVNAALAFAPVRDDEAYLNAKA